ncbi:unnamed protein product, partial [Effrenium voratum]
LLFRPLQERQVTERQCGIDLLLAAGNVDAAWQQLSDAAEYLLAEPNAQGRASVAWAHPCDELPATVIRTVADFVPAGTDLQSGTCLEATEVLEHVDSPGEAAVPQRATQLAEALHPQLVVEEEKAQWLSLWNKPHLADGLTTVQEHLNWLGTAAQGLPSHLLQVDALSLCPEDLQQAARRAKGKAAGADGRDATMIHAQLNQAIADNEDETLVVLARDLSKAFDTVHVGQAVAIMSKLGAPVGLCEMVRNFYGHCRKVFRLEGRLSQKWEFGNNGLLQGCPLSPLLLAAVTSVWTTAATQDPAIQVGVFMDDRTAWMKGHSATTSLQSLLQVTEQVDALVGFQANKSKKQVAATPSTQQRVNQATPAGFPQCCAQLRALGLQYNLESNGELCLDPNTLKKFTARARLIPFMARARHA